MKQAIAIVQARMGSARLPGKSLAPVFGQTMLGLLLTRLQACHELDGIVVATTTGHDDDAIEAEAHRMGVPCVHGPTEDVLQRFALASLQHPAQLYVRICADNPLTDPEQIDHLVRFAHRGGFELAYNHRPECGLPDGVGAEALTLSTLDKLNRLATVPEHRERVTLYVYDNPQEFHVGRLDAPEGRARSKSRVDVDYPKDLEFVRELCQRLPRQSAPLWTTAEVIATLELHPEVLRLRHSRAEVG